MEEKPKSLWNKSWKGPRAFFFWLSITSLAAFVFALTATSVTFAGTPLLDKYPVAGNTVEVVLLIMAIFIAATALAFTFYGIVRWFCCWRNLRRFFFVAACVATALALFYAEEDWRGKQDWEKYQREEEAKGERFDWQSVVPAPVPDDQNFAFSPVWIAEIKTTFSSETNRSEAWYGNRIFNDDVSKLASLVPVSPSGLVGTNWWSRSYGIPDLPELSSLWPMDQFTDLRPWQTYYRNLEKTNALVGIPVTAQPQSPARDVLLALSKFDPVIEKERQDSALPYSRFPIGYDAPMPASILLPHLAALVQHSKVLQLRATAELQLRENDRAFADAKLILRLNEAVHTEAILISQLVRLTIVNRAIQVIWEGLATQEWSAAQLADLDSQLARLDFLADFSFAVRGQRAFEIADIEYFQHPRNLSSNISPFFRTIQMFTDMQGDNGENPTTSQILMLGLGPSGWLDQNKLRAARFETKWYLPILDPGTKTISPSRLRAALALFHQETQSPTPENLFERMSFDSGWRNDAQNEAQKFAYAQSSMNLARVAIALERYRLAHGEYPEVLAALTPQFLSEIPHDVTNGQPLKYRREANGQFVLYSVGWNETDDGGVVVLNKSSELGVDLDQGDWVWRYPSQN
jgi:hypothetical protein